MKPIDKYREKFIELLKEAEEELGEELIVKVCSRRTAIPDAANAYPYIAKYQKEYRFELGTATCVY